MPCPHPLDPLCVAVLLRLSSSPSPVNLLARDLQVDQTVIGERLKRLSGLGAVNRLDDGGYNVLPGAYRVIMNAAASGFGSNGATVSCRDETAIAHRLHRLQREPMFRELPHEELTWLASVSRVQELMPREVLSLEGAECRGLYIVDTGRIRLSKSSTSSGSGSGREQTIQLMRPGDSFNEVPVLDGGTNPVTAEAAEASRVILVPKKEVLELVRRSPRFANLIITIMAQRLRHMLAMVEDVSMLDVTGRVAKILLQMDHPSIGVGAGVTDSGRLTQREIADMAGTAREVVARVLKKMETAGAVSVNRGQVTILDLNLLRSFT